jgi:Fur family ferric uptake transcriptional regulator
VQEQSVKEHRRTRQRAAVDEVLDESTDFISAQELHAVLRSRGAGVGLATVYRTLQSLADEGRVDMMRTGGAEALYRRCLREEHHHHLVCRSCGATVEIAGPAVERWTKSVADKHGYIDVSHTVEIFGTCPRCANQSDQAPTS